MLGVGVEADAAVAEDALVVAELPLDAASNELRRLQEVLLHVQLRLHEALGDALGEA